MEKEEGRRAGFWFLAKQKWKRVKREQVHLVAKLQKSLFPKEERKKFFIFIFQRLSDSNKSLPSCSFFFFSLSTHFPVCCLASFLPHKDRRNPTLEGEQGLSLLLLFGGFFSSFELSGISSKKTFFFFFGKKFRWIITMTKILERDLSLSAAAHLIIILLCS